MNTLKSSMNLVLKQYGKAEYFGENKFNLRHGMGIMRYENGKTYEGHWVNDYKEGLGAERSPNNERYIGYYLKGKPQGQGSFYWSNGDMYQGEWNNGLRNGSGKWKSSKGEIFECNWENDKPEEIKPEEKVSQIFNHDEVFSGTFEEGFDSEWSRICYNNGDIYFGSHQNQIPNGYGRLIEIDGGIYTGNFDEGKKNGFGKWQKIGKKFIHKYSGMFSNDVKHGYGIYTWESGSQYKGQFVNDEREGLGEMTWSDGDKFLGEWSKGKQNGFGKIYNNNGEIKLVYVQDNNIVDPPFNFNRQIPEELNDPHFRIESLAPSDFFLSKGNPRLQEYDINDQLFKNPILKQRQIRLTKNIEPRQISNLSMCSKSFNSNNNSHPQFLIKKINTINTINTIKNKNKNPQWLLVENDISPVKTRLLKKFRIRNRSTIKSGKSFKLIKRLPPEKFNYIS